MVIPVQHNGIVEPEARGPAARTRKLMLDTTMRLMQAGHTPSVTDVAEAAGVSRATAYRYFPSQAALVHAAVDASLAPILDWTSDSTDPEERIVDLLDSSMPVIRAYEATFKASLKLSLDQWARSRSDTLGEEPLFKRGHRKDVLQRALAPLKGKLPRKDFLRLAKALSMVYGLEVLLVLKDIWGTGEKETRTIVEWTARAILAAALADAGLTTAKPAARRGKSSAISK